MKLPGWQASISTAMPRKSPAIQGDPAKVKAKTMNFVALDDPNDYLRLGQAKANKAITIGKTINTTAAVYTSIKEAEDTSAAEVAAAHYIEEQARRKAELDMSEFSTVDPSTGQEVQAWRTAVDDYDAFAKEYKKQVLESREWGTKGKAIIERKFSATDAKFRTDTQTFVNARLVDSARADAIEGLEIAANNADFNTIEDITSQGVNKGTLGRKEGLEMRLKYEEEAWGHIGTKSINVLRMTAPNISKAEFDRQYNDIIALLQSPEFGSSPKTTQALFKQAVDLKNDYEDRILTQSQNVNYGNSIVSLGRAIKTGDPVAINRGIDKLLSTESHEALGSSNFLKLAEDVSRIERDGTTSRDAAATIARLEVELGDGTITESVALSQLNGLRDMGEVSTDDYATGLVMIGSAQDPFVKTMRATAKEVVWKALVGAQEHEFSFMPGEAKNKKAGDVRRANNALIEINTLIDRAVKGNRPLPDIRAISAQYAAEATYIEPYMVNEGGKIADSVWKIDEVLTKARIDSMYEKDRLEGGTAFAAPNRKDRLTKLESALMLQRVVPEPTDEQ